MSTLLAVALTIFAYTTEIYAIADYVSGAESYEFCWRVDGVEQDCSTSLGVTAYLTQPPCVLAAVVARGIVGGVPQPWQAPSRSLVANPVPGDANHDGVVGTPDYTLLSQHWGETCE